MRQSVVPGCMAVSWPWHWQLNFPLLIDEGNQAIKLITCSVKRRQVFQVYVDTISECVSDDFAIKLGCFTLFATELIRAKSFPMQTASMKMQILQQHFYL